MAIGTVTSIIENGVYITLQVTVGGAVYTASLNKAIFDALLTVLDKQNYIISVMTGIRRTSRQYETIYPLIVGTVLTIPD